MFVPATKDTEGMVKRATTSTNATKKQMPAGETPYASTMTGLLNAHAKKVLSKMAPNVKMKMNVLRLRICVGNLPIVLTLKVHTNVSVMKASLPMVKLAMTSMNAKKERIPVGTTRTVSTNMDITNANATQALQRTSVTPNVTMKTNVLTPRPVRVGNLPIALTLRVLTIASATKASLATVKIAMTLTNAAQVSMSVQQMRMRIARTLRVLTFVTAMKGTLGTALIAVVFQHATRL